MPDVLFSDRQIQIVNAAIKLIGTGGIQMLTTKNLAQEVGVTEPALYRHFSDKVDILHHVLTYLKGRIVGRLALVTGSQKCATEKLHDLVTGQFEAFMRRPEVVVVLLSEGLYQNNAALSAEVQAIMKDSSVYYTGVIVQGQAAGEFRSDIPAERLAFMIMGSMRFCVIPWHLSGRNYDLKPKGEELLATFALMMR